ncbi:hypothetical protein TCAL_09133 [Tigriopus californicus]|uniref:Uncharacterized protein n=1 Tax=Tigriopus californicus TaxID=6832 RepID=A0A553N925_TIGCA|nr:uncharacterized protein LOC131885720 [Tigriopus californicus]TRY61948.1 hypothetical protein TCAL_09133 [Tigriopus californicus]
MFLRLFTLTFILAGSWAMPTPTIKHVPEVVKAVSADITNIGKAKVAVLNYSGKAFAEAIGAAMNTSTNFLGKLDVEAAINDTEKTVTAQKMASIKGAFDAKRAVVKNIQAFRDANKESVQAMYNSTLSGLGYAMNQTVGGLNVSKTVMADFVMDMNFGKAQQMLANAFNSTMTLVEKSANALVQALLATKYRLHNAALKVDSKTTVVTTKNQIGGTLETGTNSALATAEKLGVFATFDNLIKGVADIPLKVNKMVFQGKVKPVNDVSVTEEEDKPQTKPMTDFEEEPMNEDFRMEPVVDIEIDGHIPDDVERETLEMELAQGIGQVVSDAFERRVPRTSVEEEQEEQEEEHMEETMELMDHLEANEELIQEEKDTDETELTAAINTGDFTEEQLTSVLVDN